MILVWGIPEDSPAAAVMAALERAGWPVVFFDQHEAHLAELELSVDRQVSGALRLPQGEVPLEAITAAYLRPHDSSRLPAAANAALEDGLLGWSEVTPARVVNRPSAMASNNSKPYQSMLIHSQGFDVPETLITTDAEALEAFWEKHGQIIYKSISGVRSIVTRLTPGHRERFADLNNCPTQFQQWIAGDDFRVHVTGDEVFACRVSSPAADYRYPRTEEETPQIEAFAIPADLADRCRRLAAALSLDVAGIDLRRTRDDRWYCFEVNPSPGFTYYEQATGLSIADAIARLLARG